MANKQTKADMAVELGETRAKLDAALARVRELEAKPAPDDPPPKTEAEDRAELLDAIVERVVAKMGAPPAPAPMGHLVPAPAPADPFTGTTGQLIVAMMQQQAQAAADERKLLVELLGGSKRDTMASQVDALSKLMELSQAMQPEPEEEDEGEELKALIAQQLPALIQQHGGSIRSLILGDLPKRLDQHGEALAMLLQAKGDEG